MKIIERFSIWKAHNERCIYCGKPIQFNDLDIDHILPKDLINNVEEFEKIKKDYELDSDFSINDHSNLVPCHRFCNQRKAKGRFSKGTALYYLDIAKKKIDKVKGVEERFMQNAKKDKALISLGIVFEKGLLSKGEVASFLNNVATKPQMDYSYEPLVISFGLLIEDVMDSELLPEDAPTDYPHLCDWLEKELIDYLKSILSCSFSYAEPSFRDGESLTVRSAFWQLDIDEIDKFSSPWWKILEFAYFPEIYGISAREYYS